MNVLESGNKNIRVRWFKT